MLSSDIRPAIRRRVSRPAVLLALVLSVVLLAPTPASAGGDRFYQGPTASAPYKGIYPGAVRMHVVFEKANKLAVATAAKSRRIPTEVVTFEYYAIPMHCADGSTTIIGNINEAGDPRGFDRVDSISPLTSVKKRRFSFELQDSLGESGVIVRQVSGRIPRRGTPSGTIRVGATSSSRGFCDSGVISWTAPRVSVFTDP